MYLVPIGIRIMEDPLMPQMKDISAGKNLSKFYAALYSGKITVLLITGAAQSSDKL